MRTLKYLHSFGRCILDSPESILGATNLGPTPPHLHVGFKLLLTILLSIPPISIPIPPILLQSTQTQNASHNHPPLPRLPRRRRRPRHRNNPQGGMHPQDPERRQHLHALQGHPASRWLRVRLQLQAQLAPQLQAGQRPCDQGVRVTNQLTST